MTGTRLIERCRPAGRGRYTLRQRVTGSGCPCRFSLCIFFACFVAAQGRVRLSTELSCLAYAQNGALYLACAAYTLLLAPPPLDHLPAAAAAAAAAADRHEAMLHLGCELS